MKEAELPERDSQKARRLGISGVSKGCKISVVAAFVESKEGCEVFPKRN